MLNKIISSTVIHFPDSFSSPAIDIIDSLEPISDEMIIEGRPELIKELQLHFKHPKFLWGANHKTKGLVHITLTELRPIALEKLADLNRAIIELSQTKGTLAMDHLSLKSI